MVMVNFFLTLGQLRWANDALPRGARATPFSAVREFRRPPRRQIRV